MKKFDTSWKVFSMYMLIIFLMLLTNSSFGQIVVTHLHFLLLHNPKQT